MIICFLMFFHVFSLRSMIRSERWVYPGPVENSLAGYRSWNVSQNKPQQMQPLGRVEMTWGDAMSSKYLKMIGWSKKNKLHCLTFRTYHQIWNKYSKLIAKTTKNQSNLVPGEKKTKQLGSFSGQVLTFQGSTDAPGGELHSWCLGRWFRSFLFGATPPKKHKRNCAGVARVKWSPLQWFKNFWFTNSNC